MPESVASSRYEQLARGALLEITSAEAIGSFFDETDEGDGVVSLLFTSAQPGYPGWKWTVSIGHVDGLHPTVLEVELMPGDGSLLAPDWVPWSDRLADYKAAQEALGLEVDAAALAAGGSSGGDSHDDADDDDDDDDEEEDADDDDDFGRDVLHGGDVDGVDIDDLDSSDDDFYDDAGDDGDDDSGDDGDTGEREKSY
jgi:hypothetical protein